MATAAGWLQERLENLYKKDPGYSDKAASLFTLDLQSPQELPDNLRGEQWNFVQLPLSALMDELKQVKQVVFFHSIRNQYAAPACSAASSLCRATVTAECTCACSQPTQVKSAYPGLGGQPELHVVLQSFCLLACLPAYSCHWQVQVNAYWMLTGMCNFLGA